MQRNRQTYAARSHQYGPSEFQAGDLYLPNTAKPPVICLLHGGFWRMPYGRDDFAPVAEDFAARGYAVWNLEYRRLGAVGGGWPGTLRDVAAGIDHLAALVDGGFELDLDRVAAVGHSAGGHLALWVAARNHPSGEIAGPTRVRVAVAVGLAPVADLAGAQALDCGNGAVQQLLGGAPEQWPERYAAASPAARLPLGVTQLLMHGSADDALPVELSRRYVQAARTAGDDVEFIELPAAGHMDFLDPDSAVHARLCAWLAQCPAIATSPSVQRPGVIK